MEKLVTIQKKISCQIHHGVVMVDSCELATNLGVVHGKLHAQLEKFEAYNTCIKTVSSVLLAKDIMIALGVHAKYNDLLSMQLIDEYLKLMEEMQKIYDDGIGELIELTAWNTHANQIIKEVNEMIRLVGFEDFSWIISSLKVRWA